MAGLRFKDEAVIDIREDGIVMVDKEGVRATDKAGGGSYVSQAVILEGKKVIVMVKSTAR